MVSEVVNTFIDDDQHSNFWRNTNNFRVPVGLVENGASKEQHYIPI
jgi:hypothetical protein